MDPNVAGFASTIASVTFYVTVAIILGGIVSGLVALGILQVYARERIQRAILFNFFERPWHESGFWRSGLMMFGFCEKHAHALQAAKLLGMPEQTLCRLYYRQVSGQFLAAVNAEAASVEDGRRLGPTPILDYLRNYTMDALPNSQDLDRAARAIDALQARLGDGVTRSAMSAMAMSWGLFFFAIGALASADRYDALLSAGWIGPGVGRWLTFWATSLPVILVAALALAFCAAACGLVALTWLDRATAAR